MENETNSKAITVSPAKLLNGAWGVVSTEDLQIGDTVTVRTRGGKTWEAKITAMVGRDRKGSLYGTAKCNASSSATPSPRRAPRSRSTRTGCDCGSRERDGILVASSKNCWQCNHDA